jgi:predicted AAA+ superfamily ATPase
LPEPITVFGSTDRFHKLIDRADALITRLEGLLPAPPPHVPRGDTAAWRWCRTVRAGGGFVPVNRPAAVELDDLVGIDEPKAALERNTRQFLQGLPCNNALLWGARGTGKSSLVKAILAAHRGQGLRLVEVGAGDLVDLPEIVEPLGDARERFIVFADDLAFDGDDAGYRALKAVLEGSVAGQPDNVVVYATSNRRHLMPEWMSDNREPARGGGEIHPGEAVDERISLSERFGLWLAFHRFDQETYWAAVQRWLQRLDPQCPADEAARAAALQWARARGAPSGRVARQFALDWAGRGRL